MGAAACQPQAACLDTLQQEFKAKYIFELLASYSHGPVYFIAP